jgi:hypothetical protein
VKRAVILALVAAFVFVAAACKRGGAHTCATDPQAGCVCKNDTFAVAAGMKPSAECGKAPEGAPSGSCCHDLDSKGESTWCSCARPVCYKEPKYGPDFCHCAMHFSLPEGATVVPSCEGTSPGGCCFDKQAGSCGCGLATGCGGSLNLVPIDRCTAATVKPSPCGGGSHEAKTCDGVKWKSKT